MLARVEPFWTWHTPIAWTAYILLVDGFHLQSAALLLAAEQSPGVPLSCGDVDSAVAGVRSLQPADQELVLHQSSAEPRYSLSRLRLGLCHDLAGNFSDSRACRCIPQSWANRDGEHRLAGRSDDAIDWTMRAIDDGRSTQHSWLSVVQCCYRPSSGRLPIWLLLFFSALSFCSIPSTRMPATNPLLRDCRDNLRGGSSATGSDSELWLGECLTVRSSTSRSSKCRCWAISDSRHLPWSASRCTSSSGGSSGAVAPAVPIGL